MKALFPAQTTPPHIASLPPYTWNLKSSPLLPTTIPIKNPSRKWKIQAKSKGFDGGDMKKQKLMLKEENKKKKEEDADDKIPDVVIERMIGRILFNVGVPLLTGLGLLQGFSVIKEQNLWQVPRWLPFLTTFLTFGASTLGIAYGTLSTSWDEENKGSVIGFAEAKKNWIQMWKEDDAEKT